MAQRGGGSDAHNHTHTLLTTPSTRGNPRPHKSTHSLIVHSSTLIALQCDHCLAAVQSHPAVCQANLVHAHTTPLLPTCLTGTTRSTELRPALVPAPPHPTPPPYRLLTPSTNCPWHGGRVGTPCPTAWWAKQTQARTCLCKV